MTTAADVRTYTLDEAAAICHCHRDTYRELIVAGQAPGRKVGRAYVIESSALAAYLKGEYIPPARQASAGRTVCFTNPQTAEIGTLTSRPQAAAALDALLAQPIRSRRRNTTTA